jgi:hypothetical protein
MSRRDLEDIFAKAKKPSGNAVKKGCVSSENPKSITKSKSIRKVSGSSSVVATLTPKSSRKTGSSSDPFGLTSSTNSSLDFTEEGWKVYTPDELKIGGGKDTPDCPFDCECCF